MGAEPSDPPSNPKPGRARVLLVEDNLDHAVLARNALQETSIFEVVHVRRGSEALETLQRMPFQAVVVDYRLPDWEGLKLVRELRERGFEGRALVVSAAGQDALAQDAREAGADDYLYKSPGFHERLADTLAALIERGSG